MGEDLPANRHLGQVKRPMADRMSAFRQRPGVAEAHAVFAAGDECLLASVLKGKMAICEICFGYRRYMEQTAFAAAMDDPS